jgi:hypothetical protein
MMDPGLRAKLVHALTSALAQWAVFQVMASHL